MVSPSTSPANTQEDYRSFQLGYGVFDKGCKLSKNGQKIYSKSSKITALIRASSKSVVIIFASSVNEPQLRTPLSMDHTSAKNEQYILKLWPVIKQCITGTLSKKLKNLYDWRTKELADRFVDLIINNTTFNTNRFCMKHWTVCGKNGRSHPIICLCRSVDYSWNQRNVSMVTQRNVELFEKLTLTTVEFLLYDFDELVNKTASRFVKFYP